MSRPQPAATSPQTVYIETPNLYIRTLTVDDASDRWAAWFDEPAVREGLNLGGERKTKADIAAYVRKFDQVSSVLLGLFDRTNDLLFGLATVYIDRSIGRCLANIVVGEAAYRHRGAMLEATPPFRDHFFETLGLKVMTATALATNKPVIAYLDKTGWTLSQTLQGHAHSAADGSPIDLNLYSLTREAWNAWKARNPDLLGAMRTGTLR
jgi:RimJ/RimL family protein N-acetyltransferase